MKPDVRYRAALLVMGVMLAAIGMHGYCRRRRVLQGAEPTPVPRDGALPLHASVVLVVLDFNQALCETAGAAPRVLPPPATSVHRWAGSPSRPSAHRRPRLAGLPSGARR